MNRDRNDIYAKVAELDAPVDLSALAQTPAGQSAILSGKLAGTADRRFGRDFMPPKRQGDPRYWAIDRLEENAYRKAYLNTPE